MIDAASTTLDDKLEYLHSLCGSGDEAIETHFAWVFLIGERALKLRKPVRRDTMDYSTLAARHLDSEEEVRLNRRLAPDVYLRTVPLVVSRSGRVTLDEAGDIVDWLVEMRRVVDLLTAFYAASEPAISDAASYVRRLEHQVEANALVLESSHAGRASILCERQLAFLACRRPGLESRVARGCVIEAHGDLRPEHILLAEPPAIIDCLEFDLHLRILDRAEELCFLELECARLGHAATGRWLLRECLGRLSDDAPEPLLHFYRSHRAATRAKLYAWRAREPDGGTPAEWLERSGQYLETALDDARLSLG